MSEKLTTGLTGEAAAEWIAGHPEIAAANAASLADRAAGGARHTPGPWWAPSAGIWTADGECMIASVGGRYCTASRRAYARKHYGDGPHTTRAEMQLKAADLSLIAASPGLLSALREAVVEIEYLDRQLRAGVKDWDSPIITLAHARAAIAQAEGGAA